MNYAVIMAGGSGKRLWPLSRQKRPKQVLKLLGGETLLRKCYHRLTGIFEDQNIIVLTNANFVETVRDDLPELPKGNIIAEPAMRDTASAIGLAAAILHKRDADSKMAVVTADQLLQPVESFQQAMQSALNSVDDNPEALLTFGIQPTFPSTQLGYIKFSQDPSEDGVHRIEAFREKPDHETAKQYIEDGSYAWNSGLFVWKCKTILDNLKKYVPDSVEPLAKIRSAWGEANQQAILEEWFPKMPKISIDYAVMEKSSCVYGISLNCQWHDLGSFRALRDIIQPDVDNNTIISDHTVFLESSNNIVVTEDNGHMLALIGVEDMIIAHSPDATLVCPVKHAGRLKELLEKIQHQKMDSFL
ncbi:MAG: mannose-1-phosphate guanylyltransferase [Planctomycetota bacterium]|jgi:mannose-1-phosphate guanylyltransferase